MAVKGFLLSRVLAGQIVMVSIEVSKSSGHYPRDFTFSTGDWDAIAPFWFPVAFSHDVTDRPVAATLLDQRLVIWRTSQGVSIANDLCLHRGVPMSMGHINNDQLIC